MPPSPRRLRETQDLRRRILDATEQIIAREGRDQVTVRRLAAAVEYAPTVLYRLFGSKGEVFEALVERGLAGLRAGADEVMARPGLAPAERLAALVRAHVDHALAHPETYRLAFELGDVRLEDGAPRLHHGRRSEPVFAAWLETIDQGRATGLWAGEERLEIFQTLWSRVHGLIGLRLQHRWYPWPPLERQLATVLDGVDFV